MSYLNTIFTNWTSVIMPITIYLSFGFIIVALIVLTIIDAFN